MGKYKFEIELELRCICHLNVKKQSFLVQSNKENNWIEAVASSDVTHTSIVWSVFQSNGVEEQKTLNRAKERLIAASFKSNMNTISRHESIKPSITASNTACDQQSQPRLDKRIRLLEAKIDNLTRVIARMNK